MYVVTDTSLIQTIQKQHRVLAFPPVAAKFAATISGSSQEALDVLAHNVNGDDGPHGLSMQSRTAIHDALMPGTNLDDMNRAMIQEVARALDALLPSAGEECTTININAWLRKVITTATTRSVYGPLNPYENPHIADAFWEFERGLMSILLMPSIFTRAPAAARDRIVRAFEQYYADGGHHSASTLTQWRYKVGIDNNLPVTDIARFEASAGLAILVNTTPATFWTLLLLHAHSPELLADIRREIDACTETTTRGEEDGTERVVKTVEITRLKESCPLLLSAYQEVLRHRSIGTSVREVREDTYLDRWLLKKGALLQMPSRIIHQDGRLWGPDVEQFNPRRFLAENRKTRPSDVCFRAFGGGKTLCPGRHFATNEVLAFVALFIARFDATPTAEEGWQVPTTKNSNVSAVLMEPDYDVQVEVRTRMGQEGVEWKARLDASEKVFGIVTEDLKGEESE